MYRPNPFKQLLHNGRRFAAATWLSLMPAVQIGITGSQGKTNTSATLFHLLTQLAPTVRTDLNLDTTYNVPITALQVKPWSKFAIFELGVDHPGEMDTHLEIIRPKIGIITGISPVHTDAEHFGSLDALINEKRKLIEALPPDGYAILNGDDAEVRAMANKTRAKVIFYGLDEANDVRAIGVTVSLAGTSFTLEGEPGGIKSRDGNRTQPLHLETKLIGRHHAYNIMAAYTVYRALGYADGETFKKMLSDLKPLPGRMNLMKGPLGTTVLDDSLRANPASTTSGLRTLSDMKTPGKKIAVLAEMGELEKPEEEHAEIGRLIATLNIYYVVAIGNLHRATEREALKNGFPSDRFVFAGDVLSAAGALKNILHEGDLLYLKGSLLRHVERVLMAVNGEQIGCKAIVCPFYHHCPVCKYRLIGYTPQ